MGLYVPRPWCDARRAVGPRFLSAATIGPVGEPGEAGGESEEQTNQGEGRTSHGQFLFDPSMIAGTATGEGQASKGAQYSQSSGVQSGSEPLSPRST